LLRRRPGLRLPGAWNAFELAVRAVLGQQVSVAAARTLAARLVERFGKPFSAPLALGLTHAFPQARDIAAASVSELASIGLPGKRAEALRDLAKAVVNGEVDFSATPAELCNSLQALRGIGAWTAQYIAMRALRDPDALPAGDLVIRQMLGNGTPLTARAVEDRAETWRPWRAYGLIHLWASASNGEK